MPFRIWYYACNIGAPLLFGIVFFSHATGRYSALGSAASCLLFDLALTGAFLAALMVLGLRPMLCPFCNRSGRLIGNRWWSMECESCGCVKGTGMAIVHDGRFEPLAQNVGRSSPIESRDSFLLRLGILTIGFGAVFLPGRWAKACGIFFLAMGFGLSIAVFYRSGEFNSNWGRFTRRDNPIVFFTMFGSMITFLVFWVVFFLLQIFELLRI